MVTSLQNWETKMFALRFWLSVQQSVDSTIYTEVIYYTEQIYLTSIKQIERLYIVNHVFRSCLLCTCKLYLLRYLYFTRLLGLC